MEDLHVAGRGGEVCGVFALPQVHESAAHRSRIVSVSVCGGKEVQFLGYFSLRLEAGLTQTWGQSASDLENCAPNSRFSSDGSLKAQAKPLSY